MSKRTITGPGLRITASRPPAMQPGHDFTGRDWCVVVSKVNGEAYAAARLEEQGYRVFVPLCLLRRKHAGKVEEVIRPLFPRYLFVGIAQGQAFLPICNTPGVSFVLRDKANRPLTIQPGILRVIHDRCQRDGGALSLIPERVGAAWKPGRTKLRIRDGVFARWPGLFKSCDNARVTVLLSLFGRETEVTLGLDDVEEEPELAA